MRTLSRPMFNMGGPIKQGIMHGIREPHNSGGRIGLQIGGGINLAKWLATIGSRAGKTFGNVGGSYNLGNIGVGGSKFYPPVVQKTPGWGARIAEKWKGMPSWFKSSVERDPVTRLTKQVIANKGLIGKPIAWAGKQLATPTGVLGLMYVGGRWLTSDGTPATDDQIKLNAGQHGPFDHTDKKKIKKAQAAFAEAQRDTRVKKYLDMMGYDRSKKTAVADALIDASKIVSDRGTLEKKNITRDLINPIIQATSKRFDKPEQIREAVGLMSVKAAIQKDMEDPTIKALRMEQLKELRGGFADDIGDFILAAKGEKVKPAALEGYARSRANKYGLDFTVVTDEQLAQIPEGASEEEIMSTLTSGDGIYKIQESIIQVIDGVPKRIA